MKIIYLLLLCIPMLIQSARTCSSSSSDTADNSSSFLSQPVSCQKRICNLRLHLMSDLLINRNFKQLKLTWASSSKVRSLRLVAVENWAGVLSSLKATTESSNTPALSVFSLSTGAI